MVVVNFDVVMVNPLLSTSYGPASFLQGKAAALFVVLAGIGFGLANKQASWQKTLKTTSKRFLFLLLIGLLNSLIFQADIIHFYAFYFLISVPLLLLNNKCLVMIIIGLVAVAVVMIFVFDFDQGWHWETYHYLDFWTWNGFFRNLLFNGWHPVIPWLGFLLLGILLSRTNLQNQSIQLKMAFIGVLTFLFIERLSDAMIQLQGVSDAVLALLISTSPVPPMPLYMVSAGGLAVAIVGLCLLLERMLKRLRLLDLLTAAGKQTLTWYLAHIILGMGFLAATNRIANQTHQQALISAICFCLTLTVLAYIWSHYFKRGPLEALMRKLTDKESTQ